MKKFIALLAALALCLTFTAGLAEETDENLISAKGLLDFWYKNKNREKPTATAEDYTVTAQLMIDGVVYPVTWAVDQDSIKIEEAEDGKYLVNVDESNPKELPYTLTATVTAPDGKTLSVSYDRVVPAAVLEMSYADIVAAAYNLADGESMSKPQRLFGVVTAINTAWSDEYKNITVTIQVGDLAEQQLQCFRLSGEGAETLKEGDQITVEGTIKNYKGTIEFDKGCKLVGFGEIISQAAILDAAYALEDGKAMSAPTALAGVVSQISTAWSDEYQNITVIIICDGKEEQPIMCYRLSGEGAKDLAEGAEIAVFGTIKNYKGTIEFDKGCKLVPVDSIASIKALMKGYALEEGAAMTAASTVTGVVTAIPTAWSDEYKNITVNIEVAGLADYPLQCYRLSGEGADALAEGDTVTVTGTIKNYKGTVEFDKGCILDAVVKAQ